MPEQKESLSEERRKEIFFALVEAQKLVSQPLLSESLMSQGFKGVLPGLDIDLSSLFDKLFPVDGDTRYEELECIGLNPNQDTLVGVIRVKLPNGYSGGPCTAGSREYVTFWADFDNNGTLDLTKTNELLQQLLDEVRRGRPTTLPAGARPIRPER